MLKDMTVKKTNLAVVPLSKALWVAKGSSHLGNYGHTHARNAIDGGVDNGLQFRSNGGPFQWIQIDLGQEPH